MKAMNNQSSESSFCRIDHMFSIVDTCRHCLGHRLLFFSCVIVHRKERQTLHRRWPAKKSRDRPRAPKTCSSPAGSQRSQNRIDNTPSKFVSLPLIYICSLYLFTCLLSIHTWITTTGPRPYQQHSNRSCHAFLFTRSFFLILPTRAKAVFSSPDRTATK